jgi:hypothetical protein
MSNKVTIPNNHQPKLAETQQVNESVNNAVDLNKSVNDSISLLSTVELTQNISTGNSIWDTVTSANSTKVVQK